MTKIHTINDLIQEKNNAAAGIRSAIDVCENIDNQLQGTDSNMRLEIREMLHKFRGALQLIEDYPSKISDNFRPERFSNV